MSERIKRFKKRQKIKMNLKCTPKNPSLVDIKLVHDILSEKPDTKRVNLFMKNSPGASIIDWKNIDVSESEVEEFINQFNNKEAAIDAIMEPAFLSLIDGSMRAFRLGTKQGLTASRIYSECKSFSYGENKYADARVDRFTEHIIERDNIKEFGNKSGYKDGNFYRKGKEPLRMRDQSKMDKYKKNHFGSRDTAEDEYSPGETVYKDNKTAYKYEGMDYKNKEKHHQSAETDHIIPCTVICNELKSNKALNSEDIKDILNDDANLAVTNCEFNCRKGGKTNEEFISKESGLSNEEIETMTRKSEEARVKINTVKNKKVVKNITSDHQVQGRLAKGATEAAGHRAIGNVIIFFIKPLHFELRDALKNGIEKGVNTSDFRDSLKKRLGRMSNYIEKNIKGMLQGGALNFIMSFFSMLIEGILNCFVGIFKHIVRAVSEGTRLLVQTIPILKDATKSPAEKGDAILKIVAFSSTALVGIGIESVLSNIGLPEPWSIIFASVLSTVIMALVMYVLEKMDLFNLKHQARSTRIIEVLGLISMETDEAIKNLLDPCRKFKGLVGAWNL